ncbi:hypothetical protein J3R75_003466 [Oligosphaera ethanolica]|uniref:Glycoside hydrolase family 42 N-terminal domain-containing protein n=1 Tax=Oligosphaera ethanolica TaxID=760260 RepID=A0AAE3VJ16_9BACT|nr:hypothetical protein [Oligosphaera ethanolica]
MRFYELLGRFLFLALTCSGLIGEDVHRLRNPTFAAGADGWQIHLGEVDAGVSREGGGGSLRLRFPGPPATGQAIAHQTLTLNQDTPKAIVFGCASKAEGLRADVAPSHALYGVELCVDFQDGSRAWISPEEKFSYGTHSWEELSSAYVPPRAIKAVTFYCRLRHEGTVWFDDFILYEVGSLVGEAMAGCSVQEIGDEIVLENDFVRLVLDPGRGGTCRDFVVKADSSRFSGEQHHDYRMFTDRLRVGGSCFDRVYTAEIIKNTAAAAELRLTVAGPDGYPFLDIIKTLRLTKYSSALEVRYEYYNRPEAMGDLIIEPYFRNGWNLQSSPGQQYLVPLADGVQAYGCQGGDTYLAEPVAGWIAAVDGQGRGMVCEFDYTRAAMFYLWRGGQDKTTAEWAFSPVSIPAGQRFSTLLTFYPVTPLTAVGNAENGIASEVILGEGDQYRLDFVASRSYLLRCQAAIVAQDGSQQTLTAYINLLPGKRTSLTLPAAGPKPAMIRYALYDGKTMVYESEHPLIAGYVFRPKQPKAKPAEILPFSIELTDSVPSRHTAWARPYTGGKLRALLLVDILHQREVVELSQRLDMECRVIRISMNENIMKWGMCDRYNVFSYADANLSLKKELATPYDVIVVSGGLWKHLDAGNTATLLSQLARGTGLVLIEPGALPADVMTAAGMMSGHDAEVSEYSPHYICTGIPLSLLPHRLSGGLRLAPWMRTISPLAAAGENASHRCVVFSYVASAGLTPVIPWSDPEPPHRYQDYSLGLLARAMIWASRREPQVVMRDLACDGHRVVFFLSGELPGAKVRLIMSNPALGHRQEWESALSLGPEISLPLPEHFWPGECIIDVMLVGENGVIDWGSTCFTEEQPAKWTSLTLADEMVAVGGSISGHATHSGEKNYQMRFELTDAYGRLIDAVAAEGMGTTTFSLRVREAATGILSVTAKLFAGNILLDRKQVDVLSPSLRIHNAMPFATGDMGYKYNLRRYLNPLRFAQFRAAGVNEIRFWHNSVDAAYRDHLRYAFPFDFPLAGHHLWSFTKDFAEPYSATRDKRYLCRRPCLNDPDYLASYREGIAASVDRLLRYSPGSFDVGDENSLTLWSTPFDFCFSEHTLRAFRQWLQEDYRTLERLNHEWGTAFADWSEVTPDTTLESRQRASITRRYAAWADHRRFMELTFCGAFQIVKDIIHEKAPGIPLDMSGTQPPNGYTGMDMWLLSKVIDIPAAYDRENLAEIIRSFGRPLIKPWYGYGNDGIGVAYRVWYDAFRFKNYGISYYTSTNLLLPDYRLPRQVQELGEHARDLREGGALLLKHLEDTPEVLIHYSHHSIHAAVIEDRYADFTAARELWCQLLDDMAIHYRFVSYEEIENGELSRNSARILILPHSSALSVAEAEAIERFAREGGLVVADRYVGIMNKHCSMQSQGLLDGLFGLVRPDRDKGENVEMEISRTNILGTVGMTSGPNPQLAGRALYLNPVGKGKALYLNLHWPQYTTVRSQSGKNAGALAYRRLLEGLFKPFRVLPGVEIHGDAFTYVRSFVYHQLASDGGARFVGLVREVAAPGAATTVAIRSASPAHLYDMRQKAYIGKSDSFKVTLANAEAVFFALMPYEITGVSITGSSWCRSGDELRFTVAVEKHGTASCGHSFQVDVFDPDGVKNELYSDVIYGHEGLATLVFRTALNDKTGIWQVTAADFISGKTSTTAFTVQ